jgi:hypothetical protein
VPELTLGKTYEYRNHDGQLVDIYDNDVLIGTYCIERFDRWNRYV